YEADQARSEGERKAIEAQAAADLQASEARAEGERKVLKAEAEKQAAELRAADAERKQLKADAVARAAELKAAGAARTEQEKQIPEGVPAALRLASGLRKAYQFTDAGEVLDQAEKLAGGGLTPDLVPIVKQAKDDLAFARELDEIRMRKALWIADQDGGGRFDTRSAPPAYKKAFLDRGFDLVNGDPAEVAKQIAASPLKPELIDALDDWAVFEIETKTKNNILAVAREADAREGDPGPWLARFRDPAVRADADEFEALAREANPAVLSPAVVVALADQMRRRGIDPSRLLFAAQLAHPRDFLIAFALGQWFFSKDPPEAIGHYLAARAIRPDNPTVLSNLGAALMEKGDVDG